jgi:hypothetical protein
MLSPGCLGGDPVLHLAPHEPLLRGEVLQVGPLPGGLSALQLILLLLLHLHFAVQGVHAAEAVGGGGTGGRPLAPCTQVRGLAVDYRSCCSVWEHLKGVSHEIYKDAF